MTPHHYNSLFRVDTYLHKYGAGHDNLSHMHPYHMEDNPLLLDLGGNRGEGLGGTCDMVPLSTCRGRSKAPWGGDKGPHMGGSGGMSRNQGDQEGGGGEEEEDKEGGRDGP